MNALKNRNKNGELITLQQAAETINSGITTTRKLAEEAEAVRKIGKSYRINRTIFLNYIEKTYAK